jgi:hypothetical protein
MEQLAIQVAGIVIGATIIGWLGIGSVKVIVYHRSGSTSMKWKKIIVLAYLIIVEALILITQGVPPPGGNFFRNAWADLGVLLALVGVALLVIGKTGRWLNNG